MCKYRKGVDIKPYQIVIVNVTLENLVNTILFKKTLQRNIYPISFLSIASHAFTYLYDTLPHYAFIQIIIYN